MAKTKEFAPMINWVYDLMLWTFSILVDLFFREVHPRGAWKVPRRGPVIFVAAPHANQFVDPLILMRAIRLEAHRRVSFLIAEKSMRRRFIGLIARGAGAVPVARALDMTKQATGRIYLPDPVNDPTLVRGVGTKFDGSEVQVGGLLVLPSVAGSSASAEVLEVHSSEEIRLKKPFSGAAAMRQLTGRLDIDGEGQINEDGGLGIAEGFEGTSFKTAPKVDQTQVYDAVFDRLNHGGCVGIFPEGGSHDRTELLPLKAGVAIMALGALAANPDCGLKIVPCGMNYFHAHKFRSRAVIEFGNPIEVSNELVELYKKGEKREAVRSLLETIYQALVSVTVISPDYDTLMLAQAVRRLYKPAHKKLPLPMVVELNRRLVKGYTQYKDDQRIVDLKKSIAGYNKQLQHLGLRDHQVEYAKFSIPKVVFTLIYRLGKLAVMAIGTLPGLILFAPVFIATKTISIKKSREALAASTVKIQGRDVMATWKLLVALALVPILYALYTALLTWWTYHNRVQGLIPEWVPPTAVVIFGMVFFPSITFAALRFGETGMDILKSLRPLVLSLNPTSANTLVKLRETRQRLSYQVTEVINTLGPEVFPDFDSARIIADPFRDGAYPLSFSPPQFSRRDSELSSYDDDAISPTRTSTHDSHHLPRNESFGNLGSIGLFATRPPSRSRSRSSSAGGFPITGFSTMMNSKEGFDEVSKRIRGAMAERGKERRRKSVIVDGEGDYYSEESEPATPYEGKKDT
ncbi:hypothetical protein FGG08_006382 [Glutinoglossum americanum]|uniref:Phospholipid/glycerol acyltransferase domain-containing protein n=1 Tax=Glutinoglossum americanum TaxID=1670608 RepID=A0A9P8HSR7_9PEZI|nr:hypothetical protein FGG08_006382 [Glutinoglossum americanum]